MNNKYNIIRLAKLQSIQGSSETTREILIKQIPKDYRDWLIGFIEGDGTFFIRSNNTLGFEISQNTKDCQILYKIKKELGFGKVYHNSKSQVSRYVISSDAISYLKITHLFKNKFNLNKRKDQLEKWIRKAEIITNSKLVNIKDESGPNVDWDNAWLSGFIDAEGCFIINYDKTNERYQLRFSITQDEEEILLKIKNLFGKTYKGKVRKDRNTYVLAISGKKSRKKILNYLKKYPLKTKKAISLLKWEKAERILQKKERTNKDKLKLENLRKTINK